jgi:hypothetical protein
MGRQPNLVELGIFSVMWSEHCSYKSTRKHIKKLPTKGPQVICGPGEGAGVVDIGDGQAVFSKWNRTTTLRLLNLIRVRQQVLAAYCEMYSLWAHVRWRF